VYFGGGHGRRRAGNWRGHQASKQLGTPGVEKSFLRRAQNYVQYFSTKSSTFFPGDENICRRCKASPVPPWLQAWKALPPCRFKKGGTAAELPFHTNIIGNFMVC